MIKNFFKLLILLIPIFGCTNISQQSLYFESIWGGVVGYKDIIVKKNTYNNFNYSFAKFKIGKSKPVFLVLASVEKDIYHWVSSDRVSIYTFNGKIVKTIGLENDISLAKLPEKNICSDCIYSYYQDFMKPKLLSIKSSSEFAIKSIDEITYLEDELKVEKYSEKVNIYDLDLVFKNIYYVDELSKRVISSQQKIHPFIETINIDFFYK